MSPRLKVPWTSSRIRPFNVVLVSGPGCPSAHTRSPRAGVIEKSSSCSLATTSFGGTSRNWKPWIVSWSSTGTPARRARRRALAGGGS